MFKICDPSDAGSLDGRRSRVSKSGTNDGRDHRSAVFRCRSRLERCRIPASPSIAILAIHGR
jgi:hypothetical protein